MDKKLSEIICSKDENSARKASAELVETCNLQEFEKLCGKMDFLFDFVVENVYKRLFSAINKDNFKNILKFFKIYSPYFDDFFVSELSKYANEDLTDEILEILANGDDNQKTYAASYFAKIPDTVAKDDLIKNLSTENEPLFINCAKALGEMKEETSYNKFLDDLKSDDEFVKLKAVKFIIAYGGESGFDKLFEAMQNSTMSENIAGEIANLTSPLEVLNKDFQKGTIFLNHIINGLGEILPLENIFYYEISDVIRFLFKNINCPEAMLLLLNLKNKFDTFTQNEEYVFELDKNTKNEVFNIKNTLFSKKYDVNLIKPLIKEGNPFLTTALNIIKEEVIKNFVPEIIALTKSGNETVVCEAVSALKTIGEIDKINKADYNFKNPHLKAIFEQNFV